MNLEVIWCRFYFQNSAFQTCLALQALTARPDEVFECTVLVHQDRGLVPWPSHRRKVPITWKCPLRASAALTWNCPLLWSVPYSLVQPLLGRAPYSLVQPWLGSAPWKCLLLESAPNFEMALTWKCPLVEITRHCKVWLQLESRVSASFLRTRSKSSSNMWLYPFIDLPPFMKVFTLLKAETKQITYQLDYKNRNQSNFLITFDTHLKEAL